jgi:methionine-S-sulfoxide reductase
LYRAAGAAGGMASLQARGSWLPWCLAEVRGPVRAGLSCPARVLCTGLTGHAAVVRVIYDPEKIDYEDLLKLFWESHDPTQGMRQRGDIGTQYRSVIHVLDSQQPVAAEESRGRTRRG